ncbi:hypothetical protein CAOG_009439 [Capsaspora owczarzaki ATCC 30864]|uniref:Uncharacterized protein n=1 Tax=Capsaspora owczarzaki (strain ATCC 30864) TaxID=595528 RepID=A0A0D2U4Z6_CAPO3|nr:hypothetical protein CAOG_009439 [Capsaspora owczarzaki ATCC 30864]
MGPRAFDQQWQRQTSRKKQAQPLAAGLGLTWRGRFGRTRNRGNRAREPACVGDAARLLVLLQTIETTETTVAMMRRRPARTRSITTRAAPSADRRRRSDRHRHRPPCPSSHLQSNGVHRMRLVQQLRLSPKQ